MTNDNNRAMIKRQITLGIAPDLYDAVYEIAQTHHNGVFAAAVRWALEEYVESMNGDDYEELPYRPTTPFEEVIHRQQSEYMAAVDKRYADKLEGKE